MKKGHFLFTSESVSEGHPDKIADQISDFLLDHFLAFDPRARVAIENLVTTGLVMVAGEVKTTTWIDIQNLTREKIKQIGYTRDDYYFSYKSLGVLSAVHDQSEDIARGVVRDDREQGAGDQGIMFGYAVDETPQYMPLPIALAHSFMRNLAKIRKETDLMPYLRPDAKSQVTIEYGPDRRPVAIDTVVISTQHDEFIKPASDAPADIEKAEQQMQARIKEDILRYLFPMVREEFPAYASFFDAFKPGKLLVNPTGKFVIGGPHGDTGLTGRKIIVDTYGGRGAHGGGAFSGKDSTKVDRSGAYAARHLAKNMVAAGIAREVLIQLSYAIGVAEPISIYVNTYGTSQVDYSDDEIARILLENFALTPASIEQQLQLRQPIYTETAAYGHFGRQPRRVKKIFQNYNYALKTVETKELEVELFTWEKLDLIKRLKSLFKL
jgi:S-adenosylmethionine synthetase